MTQGVKSASWVHSRPPHGPRIHVLEVRARAGKPPVHRGHPGDFSPSNKPIRNSVTDRFAAKWATGRLRPRDLSTARNAISESGYTRTTIPSTWNSWPWPSTVEKVLRDVDAAARRWLPRAGPACGFMFTASLSWLGAWPPKDFAGGVVYYGAAIAKFNNDTTKVLTSCHVRRADRLICGHSGIR